MNTDDPTASAMNTPASGEPDQPADIAPPTSDDAPQQSVSDTADLPPTDSGTATQTTLDAVQVELADTRDKLLRTLAEADNARKRADRQIKDARTYAVEALAYDLLPITDDLDRALTAATPDQHAALRDGVEMIHKATLAALERHGVTPIDTQIGGAFDPAVHQAVSQIPSDVPKGHLASVFTPGWTIGDRTLRAAMVAVSSGESAAAAAAAPEAPTGKPGDIVDTSA